MGPSLASWREGKTDHGGAKGELAIRARLRAARVAAKKTESLNEAVSNRMDEKLATRVAEENLKLSEDLVRASGEVWFQLRGRAIE